MERPVIHIILHFMVPLLFALLFYRQNWQKAWMLLMLSLLIDLDHLLANPVYAPDRCSIGYHPLHGGFAALLFLLIALIPVSRKVGFGLIIHLLLDGLDCYWMLEKIPN